MPSDEPQVEIQVQAEEGASLPCYESADAAGMDLRALLPSPIRLGPGERALVPTGLRLAIPRGYEGQVRPRSGLAVRHGVTIVNAPGTIDADYRGEVKVVLINLGQEPVEIGPGERIAQLVISPVVHTRVVRVESLAETERGEAGFGSTGTQ